MLNEIKGLKANEEQVIEVMVKNLENAYTKNGEPYQRMLVVDRSGRETTFYRFSEKLELPVPSVCSIKVQTKPYKEAISCSVLSAEPKKDADVSAYYPQPEIKAEDAWQEVNAYYKQVKNVGLRKLILTVLTGTPSFKTAPLHAEGAYARQSGILEATSSLLALASEAAGRMHLDKDLVLSAGILYYCGNTELVGDNYLSTEDDVLMGESMAAVKKIILAENTIRTGEKAIPEDVLPKRTVNLLCHILGSRTEGIRSAIPEAILLRNIDNAIQRADEAKGALKSVESGCVVNGMGRQKYLKL